LATNQKTIRARAKEVLQKNVELRGSTANSLKCSYIAKQTSPCIEYRLLMVYDLEEFSIKIFIFSWMKIQIV